MKMSVSLRQHFWKTKMCPLHLQNKCTEGAECDYAHSWADLRTIPDLRRTKLCFKLLKGERCHNKKCNYAHTQEELKSAQNLFAYKSSMCKFVGTNNCLNGSTCRFAHSVEELRVPKVPDIMLEKADAQGEPADQARDQHSSDETNQLKNGSVSHIRNNRQKKRNSHTNNHANNHANNPNSQPNARPTFPKSAKPALPASPTYNLCPNKNFSSNETNYNFHPNENSRDQAGTEVTFENIYAHPYCHQNALVGSRESLGTDKIPKKGDRADRQAEETHETRADIPPVTGTDTELNKGHDANAAKEGHASESESAHPISVNVTEPPKIDLPVPAVPTSRYAAVHNSQEQYVTNLSHWYYNQVNNPVTNPGTGNDLLAQFSPVPNVLPQCLPNHICYRDYREYYAYCCYLQQLRSPLIYGINAPLCPSQCQLVLPAVLPSHPAVAEVAVAAPRGERAGCADRTREETTASSSGSWSYQAEEGVTCTLDVYRDQIIRSEDEMESEAQSKESGVKSKPSKLIKRILNKTIKIEMNINSSDSDIETRIKKLQIKQDHSEDSRMNRMSTSIESDSATVNNANIVNRPTAVYKYLNHLDSSCADYTEQAPPSVGFAPCALKGSNPKRPDAYAYYYGYPQINNLNINQSDCYHF